MVARAQRIDFRQPNPGGETDQREPARYDGSAPTLFSADETTDLGRESGTPVDEEYNRLTSTFDGKIGWVQLDAGLDDQDHLISPDERFQVAMARQ